MPIRWRWFIPTVAAVWQTLSPFPAYALEFKAGGRVNLELAARDRLAEVDLDKELVLDVETKRQDGIEALADLRITTESGGFELREIVLDYENDSDTRRLRVGQDKKKAWFERDQSLKNLIALDRSIIYDKLAGLSYVGRDSQIAYEWSPNASGDYAQHISLHTSERLNASLLYRWIIAGSKVSRLTSYSLLQYDRIDRRWRQLGGAQSLSYESLGSEVRFEAALITGKDNFATDLNRLRGSRRQVFFGGADTAIQWKKHRIKPHARAAWLKHDLPDMSHRSVELTLGARIYFQEDFYLGSEARLIHSKFESQDGIDSESQILTVLRYFF